MAFLSKDAIDRAKHQIESILTNLVPKFVKDQMQMGQYTMEEAQDDVAILFCYVCDFDNILKECQTSVVPMLDSLFRMYDDLC